jgi:CdiI N-terminal domain
MFDLAFIRGPDDDPEEPGARFLTGRITLGAFSEHFRAAVYAWQAADYERQWLAAAQRLIAGAPRDGFVTQVVHREAHLHFWWPAWREGDLVYLHQEITVPELYPEPFDSTQPARYVRPRETVTAEGERISEWVVTVADLVDFVHRRSGPAPVAA